MQFSDLLRLRQDDDDNCIPTDILRKLELPMPEEVFQQLVVDHALTPFTQNVIGHLDLHGIRWEQVTLPASEIAVAEYVRVADSNVESAERQAEQVGLKGWKYVALGRKHTGRWKKHNTWLELPLFVEGPLVGSDKAMQLVEGHRRLGTLRGLLNAGVLSPESRASCN